MCCSLFESHSPFSFNNPPKKKRQASHALFTLFFPSFFLAIISNFPISSRAAIAVFILQKTFIRENNTQAVGCAFISLLAQVDFTLSPRNFFRRQNLNSDFTDSALGSSDKSPLPYGNFQLRDTTVHSILNHPRYGPKSPLGSNMYTYLKFGLPRVFPPNGEFHFNSKFK